MRNHAIFFAFRDAGYKVNTQQANAVCKDFNKNAEVGWNANLSYKTAQKLKAEGIIA